MKRPRRERSPTATTPPAARSISRSLHPNTIPHNPLHRMTRWLGALSVAVVLLCQFAAVLILGTWVESQFDPKIAHYLVYGTWWFLSLLLLLGINILFAALKKWPWKRHQTGFLITHVGLLMLVAGGMVTNLTGMHGSMVLVDHATFAERLGEQTTNRVVNRQQDVIRIKSGSSDSTFPFAMRPFSWSAGQWHNERQPFLIQALAKLRDPLVPSIDIHVDRPLTVEVVAGVPQSRTVAFRDSGDDGTIAVALEFSSPATGILPEVWIAATDDVATAVGPATVRLVATIPTNQVPQFLDGTMVMEAATIEDDKQGNSQPLATLELATTEDGQKLWRSFVRSSAGKLELERSGTTLADSIQIWDAMRWQFRVRQFLAHAIRGPHIEPLERPFGIEDPTTPPAVCVRLATGGISRDIWLQRTERQLTTVELNGKVIELGYHPRNQELDFVLTLVRGEQHLEAGSEMPASQTSHLMVFDPEFPDQAISRVITMNQPLAYGGYKFFQSNFQLAGRDPTGRPIRRCALIVTRDPGVRLKYCGAAMVALGIACMFYMRAYFFRRPESKQEPRT